MACPELVGIRIDIAKAEGNGWNINSQGGLQRMFRSEAVTGGVMEGEIVLVIVWHENNFITSVDARDNAEPRNYYSCSCDGEPTPCYQFSTGFKNNRIIGQMGYEEKPNIPLIVGVVAAIDIVAIGGILHYMSKKGKR